MKLWARWSALPALDRRLVLEALPLVAAIRLGLWLMPFRLLRRLFSAIRGRRLVWPGQSAEAAHAGHKSLVSWCLGGKNRLSYAGHNTRPLTSAPTARRVALAVATTSRYVPAASCLTQALAAQTLLRRYGYTTDLRIGVAKATRGRLAAHAWVEYGGHVLIGKTADLSRYVVLTPTGATHS